MILFIGQVGGDFVEREAFQEIDYRRMFGPMVKWVAQIDRAERIPEYVARAFQTATSGRPGPVVLALPEDMLTSLATVGDVARYQPVQAAPSPAQTASLRALFEQAQRPLILLGGGGWSSSACADLQRFAERNHLPVACAFRFQDLFDNCHPNYVGDVGIGINPQLAQRVRDADLILALGPRLGEMTTGGYALLSAPRPHQRLIHVHAGVEELGRVYQADLLINSGMAEMCAALAGLDLQESIRWTEQTASGHRAFLDWQTEPAVCADPAVKLNLWQVMRSLRTTLPRDTVLTNGAGNFASWGHRFWQYGERSAGLRTQLAPTSGAMGYGVPAGVAAALLANHENRPRSVLTLAGDGDFMMNGQELATAVQYGAQVLFIIFNNSMFGTIRMHQERHYPARISGTELHNPDFAALARAYGAFGEMVEETGQFPGALARARAHMASHAGPALIELRYDGDLISPSTTLGAIRRIAQADAGE